MKPRRMLFSFLLDDVWCVLGVDLQCGIVFQQVAHVILHSQFTSIDVLQSVRHLRLHSLLERTDVVP